MKYAIYGLCTLLVFGLGLLLVTGHGYAIRHASAATTTEEPISQPSQVAPFQPDSTFKVVGFETFAGNGLVRAVVERPDGHRFSTLLIRKPGPDAGDRVVRVGDTVKLSEITFIRNAPPSGYGPLERMLVIQLEGEGK